jgi:Tol biopolymer transport system component
MVAFTDDANGKRRLFVAAADGTGARAISPPSLSPDDPAWSPDGSRIAFAATVDGVSDIYVVDTDGNSIEQVTAVARNGVDGAFMPAWSPDGARIALIWIRYDDVDATEDQTVALVGADGGEPESLTEGPLDESPAWSASGNQIAFLSKIDSGVALKVVNPTTRTERTVTTLAPGDEFAWSPTEDSLAFVDARTGALLIEAPDGEVREVAAGSAFGGLHAFGLVSWTPDGSWVGVAARDGGDVSRIFGVPVSGGNPIPLTPAEMPAYAPMWRPA